MVSTCSFGKRHGSFGLAIRLVYDGHETNAGALSPCAWSGGGRSTRRN
jgi:hypothetical protein